MTYHTETHEIQQHVINISSREESPVGRMLSNLAPTTFELDGKRYESVESFWQGLYFPEGSYEREEIAQMDGRTAKRKGMQKPEGINYVLYEGNIIKVGSSEHHELMRRALRAKFTQNEIAREMLLGTGNARLTHVLIDKNGEPEADSKSIPAEIFTRILMELREELQTPAPIT